jgi:DNA polymerase-3 subunit delta
MRRLAAWLCQRARHHGLVLTPTGATFLIEHQPQEIGILDQSLAKLALFVEKGEKADEELIGRVVVGWQARTVFDMAEAALDGRAGDALAHLARLLQSGDEPVVLFGGLAWSLRRFAVAALIAQQREATGGRVVVKDVIRAAGIWGDHSEQRLVRLGRRRALELPQRLLELDLALKGSHSAPDRSRLAIEQFLFWVAAPATAV